MKLLLSFVLSLAVWSCAVADKIITVEKLDTNLPDNDIISSWDSSLADNVVAATFGIKKSCPGPVEMELNVYLDDTLVNTVKQTLDHPMQNLKKQNLCATMEYPEPDDDSCSIADGEHGLKDCDVASFFSDMDPGNYRVDVLLIKDNTEICKLTMGVKVEE